VHTFAANELNKNKKSDEQIAEKIVRELLRPGTTALQRAMAKAISAATLKAARKQLRKTDFHPARILRVLDIEGAAKVSLEAISLMRALETYGEKYVHDTVFASTATIQRVTKIVEDYASQKLKWAHGYIKEENGGGEYIKFDVEDLVCMLIEAFGLAEEAKRQSVEFHL
jgi:hypothetical protein